MVSLSPTSFATRSHNKRQETIKIAKPAAKTLLGQRVAHRTSSLPQRDRLTLKTQAVLNPFAVTRNPMDAPSLHQLVTDLEPLMGEIPNKNPKETLKQLILVGNHILAQEQKTGQTLNLYTLKKNTPNGRLVIDQLRKVWTASPNDDKLVKANTDQANQNPVSTLLNFARGFLAFPMIMSLYYGPSAPMVIVSELYNGAKTTLHLKAQDARFRLKALFSSEKALKSDFEALHFSKSEKKQLEDTAYALGCDISSTKSLQTYIEKTLVPVQSIAKLLTHSKINGPVQAGFIYNHQTLPENIEDITAQLQALTQ